MINISQPYLMSGIGGVVDILPWADSATLDRKDGGLREGIVRSSNVK